MPPAKLNATKVQLILSSALAALMWIVLDRHIVMSYHKNVQYAQYKVVINARTKVNVRYAVMLQCALMTVLGFVIHAPKNVQSADLMLKVVVVIAVLIVVLRRFAL